MRVVVLFFLSVIIFSSFSYWDCLYNKQWYWECSQTKNILLDQTIDRTITPEETNINLADMDFSDPKECTTDFCYKESQITVTVKKIWKPMTSLINSNSLNSWDFAKTFPNISEKKTLTNTSPVYDRFILQKVLYERWLLDSKPTWKIWYLTEQAVMALQCIKGFKEYDESKWMFIIGPKTIAEINKLKERMKDSTYLKKTRFPSVDFSSCWIEFKERNESLNTLIWNPPSRANNNYSNAITPNYSLKPEGEVKIKKSE